MDILFISRRSNHGKYFKKLSDAITLSSDVYVMGKFRIRALRRFKVLNFFEVKSVVAKQVLRKQASKNGLFNNKIFCALYSKLLRLVEQYRFLLYIDLLLDVAPKKIALWNGQKLPNETVVKAALYLNIPIVYFENGLLPNTVTVDHVGVNAKNSLPRNADFYLCWESLEQENERVTLAARPAHRKRVLEEAIILPKKYLFIPFQVPNDTQVICNSPWIKSMEQLVDVVVKASISLDPDIKLIFKEHPSWPQNFSHLYQQSERVLFANGNCTQALIESAIGVITINSTVGIESLLLNKKVITLGDACFNIEGLVLIAHSQMTLNKCVNQLEQWQPSSDLRSQFNAFLKYRYSIPTRWSKANDEHFSDVEARLRKRDDYSLELKSYSMLSSNELDRHKTLK